MATPSFSVLVAATPSLQRYGLLATLHEAWPGLTTDTTADASQLTYLVRRHNYNLAIIDGLLPGLLLPEHLLPLWPRLPVLLLTGSRLSAIVREQLLQAGTVALLPYHTTPEHIIEAVERLLRDPRSALLTSPVATRRTAAPATAFSRRELEVLRLVVADCCNQEIADRLYLSVRTVESHRRALLQKAGAKTLVGLVVQAVREGWVAVA
ncbi:MULTISPECIES: response regulator transcription factor [Hymenobacter]|uniref:Response regulator transcription factor n=1 Tax=Hymenobacter profundi TaxID=1982110 RepID=A0ABS6X5I2_9BACT|nr:MULTISPECIES: response regulator transcription factor [Hymenobacter]MBW3130960.1 response regulator transcription factor [Hymenobacter profundi]QNE41397.1 response regulator transcription factor [Hymenobacter sp. NBH84]